MSEAPVYLNGEYLPLAQARIPVMDRGFIFGDGVYEVIPVFDGQVFRMEQHMQRLDRSLRAIHMENPLGRQAWPEIFAKVLGDAAEQSLYVHISRGVSERTQAIASAGPPTVFVMSRAIQPLKDSERGISAITHEDIRWSYCDVKATALLACVLLRHHALLAGASEAILLRRGELTEGAASNVFVVHNAVIQTPPKTRWVLPGITRDLLLELLDAQGREYQEKRISEHELRTAEEIWVASSTWEIQAVVQLDGRPVGTGRPGEHYAYMKHLYHAYKNRPCPPKKPS